MSFLDNIRGIRSNLQKQMPENRSMPTMRAFPQPAVNPVSGGIGPILPMQSITLPNGQTVQIPKINEQEISANLRSAGITPQMPLPNIVPQTVPQQTPTTMAATPPMAATPAVTTPAVTTPAVTTPAVTTPAVEQPLAPYTGAGYNAFGESPYVSSVLRNETGLDAITKQMLFGLDGQGGFIPGAMQAAEKTFFNPDGTPRVVDERRAELTPDQIAAMDLARRNVGGQERFLSGAEGAFRGGVDEVGQGIERGRALQREGLGALQTGIGALGSRLGESENLLRRATGAYDPSMTDQFYNPYEDRVVQQTIEDILEAGDKQDMAQRARDIQTGGESAFGSRARLGASERREALGRGLAEALGGIRSRGFSEAQQTGLGEFARQKAAERQAAAGLAGLAGTRFGATQTGAGALSNLGNIEAQYGADAARAMFGLGSNLQGLGQQAQQSGAFDVNQLLSSGNIQQAQSQAELDAARANAIQAQQAPLAQYQALAPFVSMAPAGSFQTSTTFAPRPSPLQSGLGVGLSTLGAMGNFLTQGGGQR
tara:strand:- start:1095 stop:2714 length:1620 start_codon:yes stop_codon:yes gene_type:complete